MSLKAGSCLCKAQCFPAPASLVCYAAWASASLLVSILCHLCACCAAVKTLRENDGRDHIPNGAAEEYRTLGAPHAHAHADSYVSSALDCRLTLFKLFMTACMAFLRPCVRPAPSSWAWGAGDHTGCRRLLLSRIHAAAGGGSTGGGSTGGARVVLKLHKQLSFGQELALLSDEHNWSIDNAVRLTWTEGNGGSSSRVAFNAARAC